MPQLILDFKNYKVLYEFFFILRFIIKFNLIFLFLEPIKTKLKDFTFLVGDEGDGFKKYETNFFPKNHPPYPGMRGMVFRSNSSI